MICCIKEMKLLSNSMVKLISSADASLQFKYLVKIMNEKM